MDKACSKCGERKPIEAFHQSRAHKDGRFPWCKLCRAAYKRENQARLYAKEKERRNRNREQYLAQRRSYYRRDLEENRRKNRELARRNYPQYAPARRQQSRKRSQQARHDALLAYGGYRCACCGETEPIFLVIDHIENNGGAHRREIGRSGSKNFYYWLRKNGYPPGFQVLCYNCNMAKHLDPLGCPHQQAKSPAPVPQPLEPSI